MRRMVWVNRWVVGLIAVCLGGLLPAHHHGLAAHAPHAEAHEDAGDDDGHGHPADHHQHGPASGHGDHPSDCGICHAGRTLYTPVAVALPALAPDAVATLRPADPDQVISLRPAPVYHGRAPPASL